MLYELYERKCCSANDLICSVHIDKGYMSRLLKRFRQAGMIERTVSERDGRVQLMVLTEYGLEVTENLIRRSREQISSALEAPDRRRAAKAGSAAERRRGFDPKALLKGLRTEQERH